MNETGSLINAVMMDSASERPEVGGGATELCWTDRHAYTVLAVSASGKTLTVQKDRARREDGNGVSDSQQYSYERNPDGVIRTVTLRRDGRWREKGSNGNVYLIGTRSEYHDFSF